MAASAISLVVFSLHVPSAIASSLVGPGAVGSYQGGGGGRRHGGYVRVSDPPVGFFIGGSTIREMNGIYAAVQELNSAAALDVKLAYRHDLTEWQMALVGSTEEQKSRTGLGTEWQLLDPTGVARFRHDGEQLIPGSGTSWSHLRAGRPEGRSTDVAAVDQNDDDDVEELPWSVVGIGAQDLLARLRRHWEYYHQNVRRAKEGAELPALPAVPRGSSGDLRPPIDLAVPDMSWTCDQEDTAPAREAATSAVRAGSPWAAATMYLKVAVCRRHSRSFQEAQRWRSEAFALFPRYAEAHFEEAVALLDEGRYSQAVKAFEVVLHLDRGWPLVDLWLIRACAHQHRREADASEVQASLASESTDYCVAWRRTGGCDPKGPREPRADRGCHTEVPSDASGFCECRGDIGHASPSGCRHAPLRCAEMCQSKFATLSKEAQARVLAEMTAPAAQDVCAEIAPPDWCSPDHYVVLNLRSDLELDEQGEWDEFKRAYKRRSLQVHPDKQGGSVRAFQRVAEAYEVLSDGGRRRAFDLGDDIARTPEHDGSEGPSHRKKTEKRYFPERFDFEPFGDPHSDRREREARDRRRLEQRRQAALARGEQHRLHQPGAEL